MNHERRRFLTNAATGIVVLGTFGPVFSGLGWINYPKLEHTPERIIQGEKEALVLIRSFFQDIETIRSEVKKIKIPDRDWMSGRAYPAVIDALSNLNHASDEELLQNADSFIRIAHSHLKTIINGLLDPEEKNKAGNTLIRLNFIKEQIETTIKNTKEARRAWEISITDEVARRKELIFSRIRFE